MSGKLKDIANEFRKLTFGEIDRMLKSLKSKKLNLGFDKNLSDSPVILQDSDQIIEKKPILEILPTPEAIFAFDKIDFEKEQVDSFSLEVSKADIDIIDSMVNQGAIKALTNVWSQSDDEIQLVAFEIIQLIVDQSSKARKEFKEINGYEQIVKMICTPRSYQDPNQKSLLRNQINCLSRIILQNTSDEKITNYEAFNCLLQLISQEIDVYITSYALTIISDLLKKNWKNNIIFLKLKGKEFLVRLIEKLVDQNISLTNKNRLNLTSETIENQENFEEEHQNNWNLLQKILDILSIISLILGNTSLESEILIAEVAASHLEKNNELGYCFLERLLNLIESKLSNICIEAIMLDCNFKHLAKIIASIFIMFYQKEVLEQSKDDQLKNNFWRLAIIIERILECEHNINVNKIQENEMNYPNFITQLNFAKGNSHEIIRKNLCVELKTYIVEALSSFLESEDPPFKTIFANMANDKNGLALQLHTLRAIKALTIANEKLMQQFNRMGGAEKIIKAVKKIYKVYNQENSFLIESVFYLFDILTKTNNIFEIKKSYSVKDYTLLPTFKFENIDYLKGIQSILLQSTLRNDLADIFEVLNTLLRNPQNIRIFNSNGGLDFSFDLMLEIPITSTNLYDQVIAIYEQLVVNFGDEDVDQFFQAFFHSAFLSQSKHSSLMIDLLSILSIHVSLETNTQIFKRIIEKEHYNTLIGLLSCKHHGIIEAALKFINVIIFKSQQLNPNPLLPKSIMIPLFTRLIKNIEATPQLLNSTFELAYSEPDNIAYLFPPNSSTVSTIMNKSGVAKQIIAGSKNIKSTKALPLTNIEYIELLFFLLAQYPDENFVSFLLKQFEATLDDFNFELISQSKFLLWISNLLTPQKINNPIPSKIVIEALNIIVKVLHTQLNKPKNSKAVEILCELNQLEDLVCLIFKCIITKLTENPIIKSEKKHFLENLAVLFKNVEKIIGFKPDLLINVVHCINILASKNSGEIRSIMKTANMFELRDNLLMKLLTCDLSSTIAYNVMKDFSFEAIANQTNFNESPVLAYLLKYLVNNPSNHDFQLLILRVLKQDIISSPKNIDYVSTLINNADILNYLYPKLEFKISDTSKISDSITNKQSLNDDLKLISQNPSLEDFLSIFNSKNWDPLRKEILERINKEIILFEEQKANYRNKLTSSKDESQLIPTEEFKNKEAKTYTLISHTESQIAKTFSTNLEKYEKKRELISHRQD